MESSQAELGQESVPPEIVQKDPLSFPGYGSFLASQMQRLNKLSCAEIVSYTPVWMQTPAGLTGLSEVAGTFLGGWKGDTLLKIESESRKTH